MALPVSKPMVHGNSVSFAIGLPFSQHPENRFVPGLRHSVPEFGNS
jgi:hypothetical protein